MTTVANTNTFEARTNLLAYASAMGLDTSAKHIQKLAQKLENALVRVERGEKVFLQVQMPPQSSKSTFVADMFLSWVLGQHPDWGLAYGTYSGDYAEKRGAVLRNIVQGSRFREVFPECELSADSTANAEFYTTKRGGVKTVGRGGGLTGYPVKVALIDSPFRDVAEMESGYVRQQAFDWYRTVVRARQPRLTIAVSSGPGIEYVDGYTSSDYLLDDKWEKVVVPAIDESGNSYWPERYPTEDLLKLKKAMPHAWWSMLYQQEPYSEEA